MNRTSLVRPCQLASDLALGCHDLIQPSNQLTMNATVMGGAVGIGALAKSMRWNVGLDVLVADQAGVGRKRLVR